MKSFTKLAVLLLTLALLCTSVFAVTAFASDSETATVSTSGSISREGVKTALEISGGTATVGRYSGVRMDTSTTTTPNYSKQYFVNEAGRIEITNTTGTANENSSYISMYPSSSLLLENTDFLVASITVGTDDAYLKDEDNNGLVQFNLISRSSVGSDEKTQTTGGINFYIVPQEDKWVLCDTQNATTEGAVIYGEVGNEFTVDIVMDVVYEEGTSHLSTKAYIYVNGNYAATTDAPFKSVKDPDGVTRLYAESITEWRASVSNYDTDDANRADKAESVWFDNIKIEGVVNSDATNAIDLAYLFKDGAPATTDAWTEWETILYSIMDADGNVATHTSIVCTNGSDTYVSEDAFRTAVKSDSSCTISLKRDVIYDNLTASTTSGATVFQLPATAEYTKTFYLNGCTLGHTPHYSDGTATRGHFFVFSSDEYKQTLNFYGGTNVFNDKGSVKRTAGAQTMFKGNSNTRHDGDVVNYYDITVVQTGGYFTDGNTDGTTWNFYNSSVTWSGSTNFKGEKYREYINFYDSTLTLNVAVTLNNATCNFYGTTINGTKGFKTTASGTTADDTVDMYMEDCKIAGSTAPFATSTSTLTLGDNVSFIKSDRVIDQGYTLAPGCYLVVDNTDQLADTADTIVCKKLSLSANLTLHSDITYNVYIPVNTDVTAVNGTDITTLDTVTMDDGSECYVYKAGFSAPEASADQTITFTVPDTVGTVDTSLTISGTTLTNTLSITNYVNTVLTNANDNAEYAAAYELMSDLVDYVKASATYFETTVSDEFEALTGLDNYTANASVNDVTEVPASETVRDDLGDYISGSTLNLEASNVKFKFTVAQAGEFTYSYVSADGTTVTSEPTAYKAGEVIEVSMRAYDLNAVITISVNGLSDTFDLAAYAEGLDKTSNAYALVVEMYNYAVSAKNYKFPAAANN